MSNNYTAPPQKTKKLKKKYTRNNPSPSPEPVLEPGTEPHWKLPPVTYAYPPTEEDLQEIIEEQLENFINSCFIEDTQGTFQLMSDEWTTGDNWDDGAITKTPEEVHQYFVKKLAEMDRNDLEAWINFFHEEEFIEHDPNHPWYDAFHRMYVANPTYVPAHAPYFADEWEIGYFWNPPVDEHGNKIVKKYKDLDEAKADAMKYKCGGITAVKGGWKIRKGNVLKQSDKPEEQSLRIIYP